MPDFTLQLTNAIASGDTEAFSRFYREHFDEAFAQARRATDRDEAFCLDVVQETMMRVIRSMKSMETAEDLQRWLRRVVKSCAYDLLRKEGRARARELAAGDRKISANAPDGDLDERLAWLKNELAGLDGETARLVLLRHSFGLKLRQIAAMVGLRTGAVDARINRALNRMKEHALERFDE